MNAPARQQNIEALTLTASDGTELAALRYHAPSPRGHIVVASATGVPQGFYRRFAEYASGHGFTTLTFDYRSVGASKPATLRGFAASFVDWARLDLAAAVEAMASDAVPLFLVGHSFGGQALGLLPNHRHIAAQLSCGAGAGWHGWMPWREALRVRATWNLVLPLLVRWKGYAPMSLLGVGEDLPLGVYRQWRRWCRFPHYFFDDPHAAPVLGEFTEVNVPILAVSALDDLWATPRSRDAFLHGYGNTTVRTLDLDPRQFGGEIGHMGYFRQSSEPLWDTALAWFMSGARLAPEASEIFPAKW